VSGASRLTQCYAIPDHPCRLCAGLKPRLVARYEDLHERPAGESPCFQSRAEAAAFGIYSRYLDVVHTCLPYQTTCTQISAEEDAALLHVVNHVVKKMDTVKHHNEQIAAKVLDASDARDQGFVRPSVLLLAPMRCVALNIIKRLCGLAQRENRCGGIKYLRGC
jgi:U3 small nucleolar RNA-associated protein 25